VKITSINLPDKFCAVEDAYRYAMQQLGGHIRPSDKP
jgi:hypothetical protein